MRYLSKDGCKDVHDFICLNENRKELRKKDPGVELYILQFYFNKRGASKDNIKHNVNCVSTLFSFLTYYVNQMLVQSDAGTKDDDIHPQLVQ